MGGGGGDPDRTPVGSRGGPHHPRGAVLRRSATPPRAERKGHHRGRRIPAAYPHLGGGFAVPAGVFDHPHEQVVFCHDEAAGLRAIIAIYSTALGPALGGTRFYPYADEQAALDDVLALSRGMAYKAAVAGLDLGGGKAVIIGDPATPSPRRCCAPTAASCESLGGRYFTACDVGTYSSDMDVIARESRFVTGRTVAHGGAGDSLGAHGVRRLPGHARRRRGDLGRPPCSPGAWSAWRASARSAATWSATSSRTGADVVVTDVSAAAVAAVAAPRTPGPRSVADTDALVGSAARRLRPVRPRRRARRRGRRGARRRRSSAAPPTTSSPTPASTSSLADRGILYAPDYVVNAGGLIQVADELDGFSFERARPRATRHLRHHPGGLRARRGGRRPARGRRRPARRAPDAEVGRLRGIWSEARSRRQGRRLASCSERRSACAQSRRSA